MQFHTSPTLTPVNDPFPMAEVYPDDDVLEEPPVLEDNNGHQNPSAHAHMHHAHYYFATQPKGIRQTSGMALQHR